MNWILKLFKRKTAVPERMEIIFRRELKLNDMFVGPRRYQTLTIVTYVTKSVNRRGKVNYEIKQNLPLNSDQFYDGDFVTNNIIKRHGKAEWVLAQEAIDKDKISDFQKEEEL